MQFNGKQPLGVVYNTSMNRPDAALTLALLYGFTGKREARIGSVCVNGSGLGAAVFCDVVGRFYTPGPLRNANQTLPPGLAIEIPMPPDPPMVKAALDRRNDEGEPQYVRSLKKVTDTSLAEAVIRNGVIFNAEAVMVLSAPATCLAKTLDLQGTKDLYKRRVKMLVVVDTGTGGIRQDVPALRRVVSEWPGPLAYCGKEVGEAAPYPAASIEKDFDWAPANPVTDAYRSFKPMPYDAPSWDMAAALYAVHSDQGFFGTTRGTIQIGDDGTVSFVSGSGPHRALRVEPDNREKVVEAYVAIASAKPVVPQQRSRPPQAADVKKPADAK